MFYNINDGKSSSKYDLNVASQRSVTRHRSCETPHIIVHMKSELITNGYKKKHSRDTQIALLVVIQAQIVFLTRHLCFIIQGTKMYIFHIRIV